MSLQEDERDVDKTFSSAESSTERGVFYFEVLAQSIYFLYGDRVIDGERQTQKERLRKRKS